MRRTSKPWSGSAMLRLRRETHLLGFQDALDGVHRPPLASYSYLRSTYNRGWEKGRRTRLRAHATRDLPSRNPRHWPPLDTFYDEETGTWDPETPFRPVAECVSCDEPTERVYECADCHGSVCPGCVTATARGLCCVECAEYRP